MKKIVLAIVVAAFASSAMATPARPKCKGICPPIVVEEAKLPAPIVSEEAEPSWFDEFVDELSEAVANK